jgi:hypothetical protein
MTLGSLARGQEAIIAVTGPHSGIASGCVTCHMPRDDRGRGSHAFRVDWASPACTASGCHAGAVSRDAPYREDVDGDGVREPLAAEIADRLSYLRGQVSGAAASPAMTRAKTLLDLVERDRSGGAHNPDLAIAALREAARVISERSGQ